MLNLLTFKYVACYISATSTIGHTLFATFHMFIHLTSRQFFGKAYLFYTLGVCLPLHLFRVKSGFDNDDDGALIFFMCCDFSGIFFQRPSDAGPPANSGGIHSKNSQIK